MERTIVDMPYDIVRDLTFNWDIDWRGQSSSDTTAGTTQVVYNQFPRWVGTPSYFIKPEEIGRWRALRAKVQGRRNVWRVKLGDPAVFSEGNLNTALSSVGLPWSSAGGTADLHKEDDDDLLQENNDKILIEDFQDVSWSNSKNWSYVANMVVAADYPAGSTFITVDITTEGVAPVLGQIMSHNDWPFLVTSVEQTSGNIYTIGVQMPLREAVTEGSQIKYIGTGLFEALTDTEGNPAYNDVGFSRPQFKLREWLR